MATIFNYESIINVNAEQLQNEINNSVDFTVTATSVNWSEPDSLTIEFNINLSPTEETALATLVAAHTPAPDIIDVNQLPFSNIDKNKLAVHPSYKPQVSGITTYAVWCGAGDEVDVNGDPVDGGEIGGGPLIHLDCQLTDLEKHVDIKFHPDHGRVWLHEAYIKFSNAPEKTYLSGGIVAMATPVQTLVNKDLEIDSNWLKFAAGGPGTGSHGFADAGKIVLIPRSFSKDGDWDYNGVNLTPNVAGTGGYKISDQEQMVHKFVNRIPTFGDCPYFSITSDETTELPKNYFLRVSASTTDGNAFTAVWHASVVLEIYRERTYLP